MNAVAAQSAGEQTLKDQVVVETFNDEDSEAKRILQETADHLRDELKRVQGRLDHVSRENEELHRMMDFNSEDENQNSFKVELQNALVIIPLALCNISYFFSLDKISGPN